jgi:hypothetical protein
LDTNDDIRVHRRKSRNKLILTPWQGQRWSIEALAFPLRRKTSNDNDSIGIPSQGHCLRNGFLAIDLRATTKPLFPALCELYCRTFSQNMTHTTPFINAG